MEVEDEELPYLKEMIKAIYNDSLQTSLTVKEALGIWIQADKVRFLCSSHPIADVLLTLRLLCFCYQ